MPDFFNGKNKDIYTEHSKSALVKTLQIAEGLGHTFIGSEHLLLALLAEKDSAACALLEKAGADYINAESTVKSLEGFGTPTELDFNAATPRFAALLEGAAYEAQKRGCRKIGTEHLLFSILVLRNCAAVSILGKLGVDISKLGSYLINMMNENEAPEESTDGSEKVRSSGAAHNSKKHETLDKYGKDLTALASDGRLDPVIGRDSETERLIQILSRRTKNNPCLIGEPGVGKTAVVEGLAQKIASGNVPENLNGKTLISLDISGMLAGTRYRGDFEERIKGVMSEVASDPSIILFIDELHNIVGAGSSSEGSMDAANIIKPALSRGELQIIGATTIEEYRKYIEKDAALERRFQSVSVGEPSPEDAELILRGLRPKYESHHKLKITDEALRAAVTLSRRYIGDRYLPDKAIDLIDEAASRKRICSSSKPEELKNTEAELKKLSEEKRDAIVAQKFEEAAALRDREKKLTEEYEAKRAEWEKSISPDAGEVTESDIAEIVTQWTGIPVKKLEDEEGERLLRMEELLHQRVIGQNEAVNAVAKAIRRSRIGLKDPNRPSGSFIFLGPTGVGKTELSKALAEILFGDENAMIRIDMSEYMEKASVSKLIGSPPGYVGYDEGGHLTEKIRRKPYSVVLFDEIEKAHPDVFNVLLQILDDGILTDSQGRRVDFKNAVIIMTSNLGARHLTVQSHSMGFGASDTSDDRESMKEKVISELKDTFRPEFINRIDEIIVFDKLTSDDIRKIADGMIASVQKRIATLGIEVEFDPSAVDRLAREGTDPIYGARPLRRTITHKVEDSFATSMLEGKFKKGDRVTVTADENGLVWEKASE